jgi:hypothetical protein
MEPKEVAKGWKEIVSCYRETDRPDKCVDRILSKMPKGKAEYIFAVVCRLKRDDGRIYGKAREYMDSIPVREDLVVYGSGNPICYAGLDDIHSTHIHQIIMELWKRSRDV